MEPYDTLKLGPNAQVQSLTVWVNRSGKAQISAIRIRTSDARAMTFIPRGLWNLPNGDLRHDYGAGPEGQVVSTCLKNIGRRVINSVNRRIYSGS